MDLITIFKQLKRIEPDIDYTGRSRATILGSPRGGVAGAWHIVLHSLQFGSAVALVAVLFLLVIGGFSAWKFFSPLKLSSLDPASLRAEAQAVDIQIQLTDVAYREPFPTSTTSTVESTVPTARQTKSAPKKAPVNDLGGALKNTVTPGTTAPAAGIDEALDRLAE